MRDGQVGAHLIAAIAEGDDELAVGRKEPDDAADDRTKIERQQRLVDDRSVRAHARAGPGGQDADQRPLLRHPRCSVAILPCCRPLSSCTRTTSSRCGVDASYSSTSDSAIRRCRTPGTMWTKDGD